MIGVTRLLLLTVVTAVAGGRIHGQTTVQGAAARETAPGIVYGLLMDRSSSAMGRLTNMIQAAQSLVDSNRPADETFVVGFAGSDSLTIHQARTRNRDDLSNALEDLFATQGGPAWLDTVSVTLDDFGASKEFPLKALVLFTTGAKDASVAKLADVVTKVRRARVPLFIVAFHDRLDASGAYPPIEAIDGLKTLATESAGKLFAVKTVADWQSALGDLLAVMRK